MPARECADQDQEYTVEDVSKHCHPDDVWVIYKQSVYNLTPFVHDHPGGIEVIREWAGKDVTLIMSDADSHQHSPSAMLMLSKYKIGTVRGDNCSEQVASREQEARADPNFLDLKQPLIWQLLTKKGLEKEYYLEQVHIGRHLDRPALLFHNPVLERLSHTPWWVIPTVWTPIVITFYQQSAILGNHTHLEQIVLFLCGVVMWTVLEYTFHRFLFHMDRHLPSTRNNNAVFTLHFLVHGVHHFLPMDRERLVMPPALMCILSGSVWTIFSVMLPKKTLYGLFSGGLFGYILYDLLHYYSHHGRPPVRALRWLKRYHLEHHYFYPDLGFGVSSPVWDWVFGTAIPLPFGSVQ